MVIITLKVNDEEVETVRWMKDVWKGDYLVKPNNMEVIVSNDLLQTEKDYLNKVMEWVYKFHDDDSNIIVNGITYKVNTFRETPKEVIQLEDKAHRLNYRNDELIFLSKHLQGSCIDVQLEAAERILDLTADVTGDTTVLPQVTC